jgi:hypothetical protein
VPAAISFDFGGTKPKTTGPGGTGHTFGGFNDHATRVTSRSFVTNPFQVPLAAHDTAKKMYEGGADKVEALDDLGNLEDEK